MTRSERSWWGTRCAGLAALAVLVGVPSPARAHIDLTRPIPREQGVRSRETPNSNLKQGPCGQIVNGRTDKVNVFEPGATIEVTWRETTNHDSYYRVAFDREGDDAFPMFEGPGAGAKGIDPSGPCPVDGQVILAYLMEDGVGGSHTLQVRLPDIECEGCTLQVIQFMYDTGRPYYFQCADLALRRADAGAQGPTEPGSSGGSVAPDAGHDAALDRADAADDDVSAASGCWSRIAPPAQTPAPGDDATVEDGAEPPTDDRPPAATDVAPNGPAATAPMSSRRKGGGCSLDAALGSRVTGAPALLLLLGASLMVARAHRARRARSS
jgi:hypothetical protein